MAVSECGGEQDRSFAAAAFFRWKKGLGPYRKDRQVDRTEHSICYGTEEEPSEFAEPPGAEEETIGPELTDDCDDFTEQASLRG